MAKKIDPEFVKDNITGCWDWCGKIDKNGYGRKCVNYKYLGAHRYMYEKFVGGIPRGMQIDHLCQNKKCVNPEHMEVVTPAENTRRAKTTKLTAKTVKEIRNMYKTSDLPQWKIGKLFGIDQSHVSDIVNNHRWVGV